jgi:hypothetical protein
MTLAFPSAAQDMRTFRLVGRGGGRRKTATFKRTVRAR